MSVQWSLLLAICVSVASLVPVHAQSTAGASPNAPGARTILYHARDLIPLRTKVHYTTLIVLPDGEDVVEATCGDKEFWIVNAREHLVSVKPAKPGSETNLNLVTTSGQVYGFLLTEISDVKGQHADLTVYVESDDPAGATAAGARPTYVPAQQVEDFRAQADLAREDARRATEAARVALDQGLTAFRTSYPLSLGFPYRFQADTAPFFVQAIFHDDHRTFIQARATELPSLYEWKDGVPNLVNFDVRDGTYVVPKILDRGYLMLGKQRLVFEPVATRLGGR
jgi:conjugative transfer protein CagX